MTGWKLTTNRKKIQRHINSVLRDMNRAIERDDLWLGRFYCQQKSISFQKAEDCSYVYALVGVEFYDRKTGKAKHEWFHKEDFMGSTWKIWLAMNNFIVEWCEVWKEDPRPSINDPWDYRKEGKK